MRLIVPALLFFTAAASFRRVTGALCTADEVAETNQLFLDAASYDRCVSLADTTATIAGINFACADLDCVTYMHGMVETLPDCEYSSSINKKQELTSALKKCDVCSDAQQNETTEQFKAAAADAACADVASVTGDQVYINWSCGTSCQSVMEGVAAKIPDCVDAGGDSQRTTIQKKVTACHVLMSSGTGQETSSSSSASSASGSYWPSFSKEYCSSANVTAMTDVVLAAAESSDCSPSASVAGDLVAFQTPCADICKNRLETPERELPDCKFELQVENLKKSLAIMLDVCSYDPDYVIHLNMLLDPSVSTDAPSSSSPSSSSTNANGAANALSGCSALVASVGVLAVTLGYLQHTATSYQESRVTV